MSGYSAVAAKTRAMYGCGLSKENFDELLSKTSVKEICTYLKNETSYSDCLCSLSENDVHRGEMEPMLWVKLESEYNRIYSFVDAKQQKVLDFWFKRREITYLKHCIRNLFNKEGSVNTHYIKDFSIYFNKNTKINVEQCQRAQSIDDFINACANTPYSTFLKRIKNIGLDYFSIAMGLDSMYYGEYWKACMSLPNKEKEAMMKLLGPEIDMLNIIWIYRSKRYFKFSEELIYTNLLPVRYRLSEEDIRSMVSAKNDDEVILAASRTKYAKLFEDISDGFYVDENYRKTIRKIAGNIFRRYDDTIAGSIAYLDLKQVEIFNIIRVIEGVRYNVSPDAIRKHIRL